MEILDVKDLSFTYPLAGAPTLRNISFSVSEGEFVAVCGATGCGKTTLLRMLKPALSPLGEMTGEISFNGKPVSKSNPSEIGFVMQDPEHQTVTDKVWHEIAFGLENMGLPQSEMARRTAEMASYFGIGDRFGDDIAELSGGQKQLISLASVMVTSPGLLILDEPTAQLDPIAASALINAVTKLNRELALTVIIVEHRLEEIIPVCDRLLIMEAGQVKAFGAPREVIPKLYDRPDLICAMPAAARISALLGERECALSVREGRELVRRYNSPKLPPEDDREVSGKEKALCFKEVYFRYSRNSPDVLRGLSFEVFTGEICCVLGGNGSGKTTALAAAAGIIKPYSGNITVFGRKLRDYRNNSLYSECLALLPQDILTVFLRNTVREELDDAGISPGELPFDISGLLDRHPYDLSGGERRLCALAKVLALRPRLFLLDEPTNGLDAAAKKIMTGLLRELSAKGITIVAVTHDAEFAAECADRCALFFRGEIVSSGRPDEFFSENSFYTTAASRITRGHFDRAVTVEKAAELCRLGGRRCDGQ